MAGVIGQVLTLVTGAAGAGGFKGLAGRHGRNGLLRYGDTQATAMRLCRRDTGGAVEVELDTSSVVPDPAQRMLLPLVLQGVADATQRRQFGAAWQDRVRRILEAVDQPGLISVSPLPRAA